MRAVHADKWLRSAQAAKRQEVAAIVEALESHNPLQQPTQHLDQVAGEWTLLYTTISITVRQRGAQLRAHCLTLVCPRIHLCRARLLLVRGAAAPQTCFLAAVAGCAAAAFAGHQEDQAGAA